MCFESNFELWFYPKAVYFECKFWISRSKVTDWPSEKVGSREKLRQRLTSLKFQLIIYTKRESESPKLSCCILIMRQGLQVSNGGPLNRKIPVKINRCLFKSRLKT